MLLTFRSVRIEKIYILSIFLRPEMGNAPEMVMIVVNWVKPSDSFFLFSNSPLCYEWRGLKCGAVLH